MSVLAFHMPLPSPVPAPYLGRPGRRPVADDRRQRLKHIRVAYLRFVERLSEKKLMARFRCSRESVRRWANLAVERYTDPEAVQLREMLGR